MLRCEQSYHKGTPVNVNSNKGQSAKVKHFIREFLTKRLYRASVMTQKTVTACGTSIPHPVRSPHPSFVIQLYANKPGEAANDAQVLLTAWEMR